MSTISRRTLMQMTGAGAVALGTPFGKISKAFAAREKEMNILCWEGYNSPQAAGPPKMPFPQSHLGAQTAPGTPAAHPGALQPHAGAQ